MLNWWTWDLTLGLIVGAFCGVCGALLAALVGYHILLGFGMEEGRRTARWAAIGFGIPIGIASFAFGYHLGSTLVYY